MIQDSGFPVGVVVVNVIWIVTSLLSALGFMAIGKTTNPSEVVVWFMVSVVPSGQTIVAVAVAPPTPTGLPFTSICTNLPNTLTMLFGLKGGVVSVAQPPQ